MSRPVPGPGPSFAVPIALSADGALVPPAKAERGERYRCPGCGAHVILRRGERRRPHFAHRGGEGCSPESALHRAAKRRLLRVVSEWKGADGPRPCISRPCREYGCEGGVVQDLPDDVTHASEEVRLPGGSVADVVLFRGETPAVAVEVRVSHPVGPEKAASFSVPWMEVRAEDALERPYWWVAVRDGLLPFDCPECRARAERGAGRLADIRSRALAVAERLEIDLPPSPPYRYVPHRCWRCGREMVAYSWPGGGDHSAEPPPSPVPPSVQYRVTEAWGDYWANCCPRCSAVQGDHYLATGNADYMMVRETQEEG